MIKCIFFDMDGVIVNSEPMHFAVWKQVFAEYGLDVEYEVYKGCIGSNANYLLQLIYDGYGKDLRGNAQIHERFAMAKAAYRKEHGLPVIVGVQGAVRQLKARGYRLAVVSSSPQEYIEQVIKSVGLDDCFEKLLSGDQIRHPKPAPDVYLMAAEVFGVTPEECAVVEDSHNGSKAAKAAGMTCYGFYNPDSGNQDLSITDRVFDDFHKFIEISGL